MIPENLTRTPRQKGFALVVTLTMMVMLSILALGLLSLSSVSLRTAGLTSAETIARSNARMALVLAISELQKNAGTDQRITARADILDEGSPNPAWTGVWKSDDETAKPVWLVSGPENTLPSASLDDAGSVILSRKMASVGDPDKAATIDLRAPLVKVNTPGGEGAYAWWIGDEGIKARIDLEAPEERAAGGSDERETLALAPLEPGLSGSADDFSDDLFGSDGSVAKSTLLTLHTATVPAANPLLEKRYFHSLTTGGFGLPVNVRDGGMKTDLSLVFDRSQQENKPLLDRAIGAVPKTPSPVELSQLNDASAYDFEVSDRSRFQLGETFSTLEAGPNLGIIYNYSRLWENFQSDENFRSLTAIPRVESDLGVESTLPYHVSSGGTFASEKEHVNSPVTVVPYLLQVTYRLAVEETSPPSTLPSGTTATTKFYRPILEMKPVMGFWNPYNVKLKARKYLMEWSLSPLLRFGFAKVGTSGVNAAHIWLRSYWKNNTGAIVPTDADPNATSWLRVSTPAVDFEPGEFRVFSSTTLDDLENTNLISPGWNELGAIRIILKGADGNEIKVPEFHVGWFAELFMQDSHHSLTSAMFPNLSPKSAMTWFTLKDISSGGGDQSEGVLIRQTNLWNGGKAGERIASPVPYINKPFVPERIVTGFYKNASGAWGTTKPVHSMKELAERDDVAAVGTWAIYLRNSSEISDPGSGQTLRGWVDTNPRTLVGSPRFDGLDVSGPTLEGWNFSSQYMGGSLRPNDTPYPYGQAGDGAGGFRGLVAEAGNGSHEPQIDQAGGRFRGYGGPSNTATGQTHVILFDVPRTPPISIGQLQHAHISRYNFEPGFAVGSSYANTRIPLDKRVAKDFEDVSGMNLYDIAYEVNEGLWDDFFFSSMGIDYKDTSSNPPTSFDQVFGEGTQVLPNPRMVYRPGGGVGSIDTLIQATGARAAEAIAARTFIQGAFNVNSTSVTAWKALLSSMGASELPVLNLGTGSSSWTKPAGIRFSRVSHTGTENSYKSADGGDDAGFWRGWRELSKNELETLAENIVAEVRKRGPFRSMADFVNRDLNGSTDEQQRGALQAALDNTLNDNLPSDAAYPATTAKGTAFHAPPANSNQGGGQSGYLMQGDILQSLGSVLQIRSDYFKIRAYGEARDESGNVTAKAWCEATLQRQPEYVSPENETFESNAQGDTLTTVNKTMGRRFTVSSFRWLSPSEI